MCLNVLVCSKSLNDFLYAKTEATAHGFRSTASTILIERGYDPDVIEAALAHQDGNVVSRAYNRTTYWKQRVKLEQERAELVDRFRFENSNSS